MNKSHMNMKIVLAPTVTVSFKERQKIMSARSKKETMQCPDKSCDRRPINHLCNIHTKTPKNKNSNYPYMDQIQTHAKCYCIRDV